MRVPCGQHSSHTHTNILMGIALTTTFFTLIITITVSNAEYLFYYSYYYYSDLPSPVSVYALGNATDDGVLNHCSTSGYLYPLSYEGVYDQHTLYTLFQPAQLFSYNIVSESSQRISLSASFNFTALKTICKSERTGVLYIFVNTNPLNASWGGFIATINIKTGILTRASAYYFFKDQQPYVQPDQCVVDDVNSRIVWRGFYTLFTTDLLATNDGATINFENYIDFQLYYSPTDGKLYASMTADNEIPRSKTVSLVLLTITGYSFKTQKIGSTPAHVYSPPTGALNLDKKVVAFLRSDDRGVGNITEISIVDGTVNVFPTKWNTGTYYNGQVVADSLVWYSSPKEKTYI